MEVSRRREQILREARQKEEARLAAEREKNRCVSELDDVLSLALHKWDYAALLNYMCGYFLRVLNHEDPLEFEERLFAECTLLECSAEREISFRLYCNEVCAAATTAATVDEQLYYTTLMRACFLVALLYDTRVQRLVMGRHAINFSLLRCKPPGRLKANAYMDAIRPDIDAFLARHTPMHCMCERAIAVWRSETFMLRRFSEAPFRYGGDIQYSDHPQRQLTAPHTDSGPWLVDELGY